MRSIGSNLLIIEADGDLDLGFLLQQGIGRGGTDGVQDGEGHHEVIKTASKDEFRVGTTNDGGLGVAKAEIEIFNGFGLASNLLGQDVQKSGMMLLTSLGINGSEAVLDSSSNDGHELFFLVELETLVVDATVEMDGQVGNAQERLVDLDDLGDDLIALLDQDAARDTQIAIEPSMPQTSSVALHADLQEVGSIDLADRLHLQARRVSVSGSDVESADSRIVGLSDGKCDDGGLVTSSKVLATTLKLSSPVSGLRDVSEASSKQKLSRGDFNKHTKSVFQSSSSQHILNIGRY